MVGDTNVSRAMAFFEQTFVTLPTIASLVELEIWQYVSTTSFSVLK
nr:hypothetical protein [Staphylococcus epidermidis]